MDQAGEDPRLGTVLDGRYRLTERVAQGSMGVVYKAERVKLGRTVAVKFLHGLYADDPQFVQRFEREVKVMSKIAHPHCVSVIDLGMADAPYVVMEFVTGQTLRALIDDGRVSIARGVGIARQMLAGLAHAHALGVVHRDIKPANIMLTEATGTGDHVRILDFGLATLIGTAPGDLSQSQIVVGTPSYMAPEQTLGNKVDARADLYATAVVLFELLTGHKPFRADTTFELIRLHREQPPPMLRELCPEGDFPLRLEKALSRALAKRPEDRYGSAIEMATALGEALEAPADPAVPDDLAIQETLPAVDQPVAPPPRRRRRAWAALAVILGGAALLAWQAGLGDRLRHDAPPPPGSPRVAAAPEPRATVPTAPEGEPAFVVLEEPDAALAADARAAADGGPPDEALALDAGNEDPDRDAGNEAPLTGAEADEPVAALPETPGGADRTEPTTLAELDTRPTSPPTSDRADTLDAALALIKAGRRDDAIAALRRVQKTAKKSPYVPYLLGNLYFEKRWWTVGIEMYGEAIGNNRGYRGRATLNRNVIRALGDGRTARVASSLIVRKIGRAALPYLDRAAKSDPDRTVRRRAAALAKAIRRR